MRSALIGVATLIAVAVLILPGVVFPPATRDDQIAGATGAGFRGVTVSAAGTERGFSRSTSTREDGSSGLDANLDVEAIQEVVVKTSATSGDHSRAAGAMVTW